MKRKFPYLVLILLVGVFSGCASTGQLSGRLSAPGRPASPVTFSFQSDRFGAGGTLSTTLPNGESFSGQYVQMTSGTTPEITARMFEDWQPYWSDWGPFGQPWLEGPGHEVFRVNYSGKVVATLLGDKGSRMRCRFRLVDPPSGLSGGGTGECQVSGGGKIDVQF